MLNRFLIVLLLPVFLFSCTDDRAPSGINSTIYYGEGDCMPPINVEARTYQPFSGKVYVIEKSIADTMINFNDSLVNNLYTTYAIQGAFALIVPPGTYYIMPDTLFYISAENLVTVNPDDLIEKEFRFFRCTSF